MNKTLLLVTLSLALSSCAKIDVSNLNPDEFIASTAPSCTDVAAAFAQDVVPVFTSKSCTNTGCHTTDAPGGNLDLTGDTTTVFDAATGNSRVDTTNPEASKLLRKALGLDSHSGSQLISETDNEYKTMYCWIKAGATNN